MKRFLALMILFICCGLYASPEKEISVSLNQEEIT
jgi:hypothetical protein